MSRRFTWTPEPTKARGSFHASLAYALAAARQCEAGDLDEQHLTAADIPILRALASTNNGDCDERDLIAAIEQHGTIRIVIEH